MKFSICITTHDRWKLCLEVLEAVYQQSYEEFEVILIDDCPHLVPPEELAFYLEKDNFRFVKNAENLGLAQCRNTAISQAEGDFFIFCDDDDKWGSKYLQSLKDILFNHHLDFIYTYESNSQNIIKIDTHKKIFASGYSPPVAGQCYRLEVLKDSLYGNVTQCVDHDLWVTLLRFDLIGMVRNSSEIQTNFAGIDNKKMTRQHDYRIKQCELNLDRWKPIIVSELGEEFFDLFSAEYFGYLYMKKDYDNYLQKNISPKWSSIKRFLSLSLRRRLFNDPRIFFL